MQAKLRPFSQQFSPSLPPLHQQHSPRPLQLASISSLVDGHIESSGSPTPNETPNRPGAWQSQSESTSSHRETTRDRRISAACAACKKRKSKCSGGPPPCKSCRIGGIECVINESLDGRRKLAAKRVQDELQQQTVLLDGILDAIRSPDKSKSEGLLSLIRSHVPLSTIMEQVVATTEPTNTTPTRTKVPINLLLHPQDEMDHCQLEGHQRGSVSVSASPPNRLGLHSSEQTWHGIRESEITEHEGDFNLSRRILQTLYERPEQEAITLLHEFRRAPDLTSFIQSFQRESPGVMDDSLDGKT